MNKTSQRQPDQHPEAADRGRLRALLDEAAAANHAVVDLDLASCDDKLSLLRVASEAFGFPAWFGQNWDALSDSLGDLSWLDRPGYLVVISNPQRLKHRSPRVWTVFCEILGEVADERRQEGVAWKAVVATDRSG